MKDVKNEIAHRSVSSARKSEDLLRPQSAKSPALSSADSSRIWKHKKRGAGTPHFPCGFMTTSIGDYKKSSGSDSDERQVLSKKDAEEVNLLSSESDEGENSSAKKRTPAARLHRHSLRLSNSKKPKQTGAYKVFLRRNIYRKNPNASDLQSLQKVIDSMQSSNAIYANDETPAPPPISQETSNSEDPPEEVKRRAAPKSTPPEKRSELTQSFVEASVSALFDD